MLVLPLKFEEDLRIKPEWLTLAIGRFTRYRFYPDQNKKDLFTTVRLDIELA